VAPAPAAEVGEPIAWPFALLGAILVGVLILTIGWLLAGFRPMVG
jgi:hypothetical protein